MPSCELDFGGSYIKEQETQIGLLSFINENSNAMENKIGDLERRGFCFVQSNTRGYYLSKEEEGKNKYCG